MPADAYSRILPYMRQFHDHFRLLYASMQRTLRHPHLQALPPSDLHGLLRTTLNLTRALDMHHRIEEAALFPLLARRMPQFDVSRRGTGEDAAAHVREHAVMHARLEELEAYAQGIERALRGSQGRKAISDGVGQVSDDASDNDDDEADGNKRRKEWPPSLFDGERYRRLVDDLGTALFPHLEAEETSLRADNLRKAGFTPQEMIAMLSI